MLGVLFVLLLGTTEKISMWFLIKNRETQLLKISFNYFVMAGLFFTISFFKYTELDFSFLYDWKFYTTLILENIGFYFAILNYNKQQSFSNIAFAAFSSIYLIIFISYFYSNIIGIKTVIATPYHNLTEVFLFSVIFFLITLSYFYDKIKLNSLKHPILLLFYAFFLVNTLYFSILMFQIHPAFLVYTFIFLSMSFINISIFFKKYNLNVFFKTISLSGYTREEKKIEIKNTFFYILFYFLTFLLSVISGNLISVEFFAIFKRLGAIISSFFIDRLLYKKHIHINKKDLFLIFFTLLIALFLYIR